MMVHAAVLAAALLAQTGGDPAIEAAKWLSKDFKAQKPRLEDLDGDGKKEAIVVAEKKDGDKWTQEVAVLYQDGAAWKMAGGYKLGGAHAFTNITTVTSTL